MALPTTPQHSLSASATGVEHRIAGTTTMTGVLPLKDCSNDFTIVSGTQDDSPPVAVPDRHILTYTYPDSDGTPTTQGATAADGNGLFDPWTIFKYSTGRHLFVTEVDIRLPHGAVNWEIFLTSGLEDGTPATTVDLPAGDVLLLSGSDAVRAPIRRELLPGQKIRVVFGGVAPGTAAQWSSVTVLFAAQTSGSGHLV